MTISEETVNLVREMGLAVFESAGEAIVITDLAGTIRYVNPSFERITGYSREEAVGQTPRILKSGQQEKSFYESLWRTITSGKIWRGSFLNRRKDGSLYHVEQTITLVKNVLGEPIGYVSLHADVSQRKLLERKLREAELREARQQAEHQLNLARKDIEIASSIQQSLFPKGPPVAPGFEIAAASFPASDACGDYFDFIDLSEGQIGVVIADVSGHGLGPALLMAETRAYLRALAESLNDIQTILKHVNRFLVRDLEETGRFVTLFLARVDPETRSVLYVGAGHDGYHLDSSGKATQLLNSGLALGVDEDAQIPSPGLIVLQPGEMLLMMTDGFHEAEDADETQFGVQRVLDLVGSQRRLHAADIIEQLYASVREFSQGVDQSDDMTVVIIKSMNKS